MTDQFIETETPDDMPAKKRRDGFALPLAIVVLTLLTMGLVAGFAVTSSEASVTVSQRAQARAYTYAQQGLETFLMRRKENSGTTFCPHCWAVNGTPAVGAVAANLNALPQQRETVYVTLGSTGAAIVRATPVWINTVTGKGTYWITSTGIDLQNSLGGGVGRTSQSRRTVGVFATWDKITMNVLGAWTSLSGLHKNGSGNVDGTDQGNCGNGNVAGVSIPQYGGHADLVVNGNWAPTGNPPYDSSKTFAQESSAMKIDWVNVKNGSAINADIVIPSGTFPSSATFAADTNYWPVIHVRNAVGSSWSLPNRGRGLLIVDEDLDISGSNQWYGVIMVGGKLTSNGNNVSEGATLSGLNLLCNDNTTCNPSLGQPGASTSNDATANGTKSYVYDSCSVQKATQAMSRYTVMSNTWMDDIPGW